MVVPPHKEKALRRLKAYRSDGIDYKPSEIGSTFSAFKESPLLYYRVFDKNLRPRSDIVYAHSLEELYYMAIDNADRLGTLDTLIKLRPSFSPKTLTVCDLILTAFVGTDDGSVSSLFACPYQGKTPYSPSTTLYAIAMSEMIPNSRGFPLRIALNVPSTMKTWSTMGKLGFFGSKTADPILLELNSRVNNNQILGLRNDPEGCVRYSAQAKAVLAKREKERLAASHSPGGIQQIAVATTSVPPSSGTTLGNPTGTEVNVESETRTGPELSADPLAVGHPTTESEASAPTSQAPLGADTSMGATGSHLDTSAIEGPLKAAKLEDNTALVSDQATIDANQSHPALEHVSQAPQIEPFAETSEISTSAMFGNTKALLVSDEDAEDLAPPLEHDQAKHEL